MSSYRYSSVLVGRVSLTQTVASTVTPASTIAKTPELLVLSTVTPSTTYAKDVSARMLAGLLTPAGQALRNVLPLPMTGTLTPTRSAFLRTRSRVIEGLLAPTRVLRRAGSLLQSASVAPDGAIRKTGSAKVTSTVTPSNTAFIRSPVRKIFSTVTPGPGVIRRTGNRLVAGSLTPGPGTQGLRSITKRLAGLVRPRGMLFRTGLIRVFGAPGSVTVTVRATTETRVNVYQRHRVSTAVFEVDDAVVRVNV